MTADLSATPATTTGTPKKKLVIFDLDGVILDSRPNMERAWAEVQRQTGTLVPFSDYFAQIGRPFRDILRRIGITSNLEYAEKVFRMASMQHISLARFYEGTAETLTALTQASIRLGVVTSKDALRTNAILAMLPVDFATVQTPNDRFRGKPAPDHLLLALAEAHADPAEALYIGDMSVDYDAAKRAGMAYLHAAWGYGARPAPDCDEIAAFREIPTYIGLGTSP